VVPFVRADLLVMAVFAIGSAPDGQWGTGLLSPEVAAGAASSGFPVILRELRAGILLMRCG
jgi:hypothetical protein